MPDNLFAEFTSSGKESWKKQVEKELKGKSIGTENWKIADNVYVEPYYTSAETDWRQTADIQNAQKAIAGWQNTRFIQFDSPIKTNLRIRTALDSGANGILLNLGDRELPLCEFTKTLHAVKLSDSPVFFQTQKDPEQLFSEISRGAGYYIKGGIANDLLANWMRTGDDPALSFEKTGRVLQLTKTMKDFRPFMIESHIYHNAGANPVQELAFMISSLVACADYFTDHGISPLHALNRFFFSVSVGPEYLTEIAKLRALRYLYRKVTRAYQLPDALCNAFVHAQTSTFYHSNVAANNNMLRRTSEAMSAVTGGCDAITIADFDERDDSNTNRIAQNISLLLLNESNMGQVADAGSGSYLIEKMSLSIAESAWALFLETENMGGLMNCYQKGFIQSEIERSWTEKSRAILKDKVIVGVNKYQDPLQNNKQDTKDSLKHTFHTDFHSLKKRRLEDAWLTNIL